MTLIFPTTAPTVLVHPLPSGYLLASGKAYQSPTNPWRNETQPALRLTAWMPDGHGTLTFEADNHDETPLEHFEENVCRGGCGGGACEYYFDTREVNLDAEDDDGNPVKEAVVTSCCPAWANGISQVSWPCPAGHDEPDDDYADEASGPLPPMAYAIHLVPSNGHRLYDSAWMQRCNPNTREITNSKESLNIYHDRHICWGDNELPGSLPEIVADYADAPSNSDLLKPHEYISNRNLIRIAPFTKTVSGVAIDSGYDAALLVSAVEQPSAYLLLRGCGYEADQGVIALGLRSYAIDHEGVPLTGYITQPDPFGLCWFLIHHPERFTEFKYQHIALLLSQLTFPDSPCSSTPPSSSVLAAAAAN